MITLLDARIQPPVDTHVDLRLHGDADVADVFSRYPVVDQARDEVADAMEEGPVAEGLAAIAEYDRDTRDHVVGVALFAGHLAIKDGMAYGFRRQLLQGALLHDLGKVDVDIDLINPRGRAADRIDRKTTDADFRKIQEHPERGYTRTGDLYVAHGNDLDPLVPHRVGNLVLTHHCHNEARAPYPSVEHVASMQEQNLIDLSQLQDPVLQMLGKYLGLADTYEAITAERSYNSDGRFHSPLEVLRVLEESYGSMDPQIEELMMGVHLMRHPLGWMPDSTVELRSASTVSV